MKSPPRILIVDDEPPVLLTYEIILRQQGYEVSAATTRSEAREFLQRQTFDLLICDLALESERGGIEIIAEARQQDPQVPGIVLTGYASEESAVEAGKLDMALLYKPIDIQELLGTMKRLLSRGNRRAV